MIFKKQDITAPKNAVDLERKYGFTKRFAEVMGIATDARSQAEEANDKFDNLDQEQIFALLTTDGENQGIYRDEEGNVYINASYIATGIIRFDKEMFVEPGTKEAQRIRAHLAGTSTIPPHEQDLYDFNEDGALTAEDADIAEQCAMGEASIASTFGADKKTKFTITIDFFNEKETIRYTGTDIWGAATDDSVGLKSLLLKTENGGCSYRVVGDEREWLNPPSESGVAYRTMERFCGSPVYKKTIVYDNDMPADSVSINTGISFDNSVVSVSGVFHDSYNLTPISDIRIYPGAENYTMDISGVGYGRIIVEIKYA